jgi:alkanesulfonate monooxygenase SsuD/methylene tetrahydromethanopterin reductase-like flavin-dependent oxidoreductase (luciferase family)
VQLTEAACTPAPPRPPRIVVGVGHSRRLIRSAVRYADELNLYASEDVLRYARQAIAESERPIDISVYLHFDWGQWPADLAGVLAKWEDQGVQRAFVNIGYDANLAQRVTELARYGAGYPNGQ